MTHQAPPSDGPSVGDAMLSLVRTFVPVVIGTALTWIAKHTGVVIDEQTSADLVLAFGAAVTFGYYSLARWIESHAPWAGTILLGSSKKPTYS